jgi:hypothetical protein
MKRPKRSRQLPAIEHSRGKLRRGGDSDIKEILLEVRGVRSTSRLVRTDGTIVRSLPQPSAIDEFEPEHDDQLLFDEARRLLEQAGETGYRHILKLRRRKAAILEKLRAWKADVALRHGFLCPITLAAEFLLARLDLTNASQATVQEAWPLIIRYVEACRWLHFEVSGLHAMAAGAQRDSQSLASGPIAKAERANAASAIVVAEYERFRRLEQRDKYRNNATHVAARILGDVNRTLAANGLPPYKEGPLRKLIGKKIKARKASKSRLE